MGGCQREICSHGSEANRCSGRSCPGSKQRGEGLGRWSEGWEAIPNGKGLQVLNISLFPCEDHAGGGARCKAILLPVSLGGSHSADWSISHTGSALALPPLVWVSGLRGHWSHWSVHGTAKPSLMLVWSSSQDLRCHVCVTPELVPSPLLVAELSVRKGRRPVTVFLPW